MSLKIPFEIKNGRIYREENVIRSIRDFVELLVLSPLGSFKSDRDFGFLFRNYRFENFDEVQGTIDNKKRNHFQQEDDLNYGKKIAGSGKNANTFAYDLKRNIEYYEKRLKNVEVKMNYEQKGKMVTLWITAELNSEKPAPYKQEIKFHVW